MSDEQNQLETNPESLEKEENSLEELNNSETGMNSETSSQQTVSQAEGNNIPEAEKPTEFPDSSQVIAALNQELENFKQQLEQQNQQADALKKRYISLAADFDNFRKRTQKEKEELETQAKCKAISELLAVVDNFERARTQIKPANDGEMGIHKSYQGVYKNLVDSLKRLGVSAMKPEGQPFDPAYHEAMLREYTNEYPEGTVIEQLVRGYTLDDRVLRHAMVKVAASQEPEANSEEETTPSGENENLNS
jgi:molecular chaperone GrpE